MSNFHFGVDDYDLNYYPPEASDGMGGVDWDKVEHVEIERDVYVKERTCECVAEYAESPFEDMTIVLHRCSACHELMRPFMHYCPNCGAKVVKR